MATKKNKAPENGAKDAKKPTAKRRTRATRFEFIGSSKFGTDSEKVVKFLNGLKDVQKDSPDAAEQFEVLCINTIGYVQPLARQVLFNTLIDKNEK